MVRTVRLGQSMRYRRGRLLNPIARGPALPVPLNGIIVYAGNSITEAGGSRGFRQWAQYYAGGRTYAPPGAEAGVSGNSIQDLLARFDTDVTPLNPKIVVLEIGTNNLPTANTAEEIQDLYRTLINKVATIGAKAVCVQILPRADATFTANLPAIEVKRLAFNAWLALQTDVKVVLNSDINLNPAVTASGGDTIDGLHTNARGGQKVGYAVGAAIRSLLVSDSILLSDASAGGNILTNGALAGSGGYGGGGSGAAVTGTIPTSWAITNNLQGAAVASSVNPTNGYNELVIRVTGTVTVSGYIGIGLTAGQPYSGLAGEIWEMWAEHGVTGTGQIRTIGGQADGLETQMGAGDSAVAGPNLTGGVIRPFAGALVAPDSNNGVGWTVYIDAGAVDATIRFSRPMLRKVV